MARHHWLTALLILVPACELASSDDGKNTSASSGPNVSPGNPLQEGGAGCGGEAAAGGFLQAESSGPTNPENPYANAVDPGAWLPCAAVGFDDNQVYCRFFEQCVIACQAPSDCPLMAGAPDPDCRQSKLTKSCVLPCVYTSECPSGMTCVSTTIGFDRVCMWGAGPTH